MNASTRFGQQWWQAALLAALGVGALRVQLWPVSDGVPWPLSIGCAGLVYPLLQKTAGVVAGLCRIPERWRPGFATVLSLATAFAVVDGVWSLSWRAGAHRFLDVLPVAIGVAIGAAFGGTRGSPAVITKGRTKVLDSVILVFALGLGFAYLAGTTDAQEQLGGTTWVWRRAIIVAGFTWIVLGGLFFLDHRSRPRPNGL